MKLGPYELEGAIGSGATGSVYRARDAKGALVAVKVLHRLSAGAVARFERERRLHDSLGAEEGFVPLLDSGDGPGGPYLVMPFVAGGTLRERLAKGRFEVEEAVRVAACLARALARAHALGIVHRDMKPENVLFTTEGEPLVADLGLAKHFEGDAAGSVSLSRTGDLRGTAGYAPVEQMQDAKAAGPPADVFAIGALLYECLAGEPAFHAPSVVELLACVEDGDWKPLAAVRPGLPAWLVQVVERCLATDAPKRFPDATALLAALADRGRGPVARSAAAKHGRPVLLALAFLVLALALLAVALARRPSSPQDAPPPPPPPRGAPLGSLDASLADAPPWFRALPPEARPRRLPAGLTFGPRSGEYVNEKDGSVLVFVPGGRFTVGTEPRDARGFFLGKLEVTNFQFASFVAATGHRTHAEQKGGALVVVEASDGRLDGAYWKRPRGQGAPDVEAPASHPVLQIWWTDAVAYCAWAGLRLPSLDEWQKAAGWDPAAGRQHVYPWGNDAPGATGRLVGDLADQSLLRKWIDPPRNASPYDDGYERSAPVDAFPESACSYGALELGGNAAEWVAAVYDRKHPPVSVEELIDRLSGSCYLLVGGSFAEYPPARACRVLAEPRQPTSPREDHGLRVCRSED